MPIASLLKEATSDVHARLHVHPLLSNILDNSLTLDHYTLVIRTFYSFYKGLHQEVSRFGIECPVITQDLMHLQQDLSFLQSKPSSPQPRLTRNAFQHSTSLNHYDDYLGLRYVMQGSHLGGMIISKHVRKLLELTPNTGLAFYTGNGKETMSNWKKFLAHCESEYQNEKQVAAAAKATFEALETYLWQAYTEESSAVYS